MTLDVVAFRKPLDDVRFPNGIVHQPVPFGPAEYQLWRDAQKVTDPQQFGLMMLQLVRACYPTVTDDDILDCEPDELLIIAAHPGRKIEQVKTALKNVAAAVVAAENPPPQVQAASPLSSPKTSGPTSASRSRKRSGKTGGVSTTSADPTDGPSSSGSATTTSKNPDESMPFAVNWKTSTAQPSPASS